MPTIIKSFLQNMSKKVLLLGIFSFSALLVLQFVFGFLVFTQRYGWKLENLHRFYVGPDGTPFGLYHHLQTALPHCVSLGLIVFTLTHFFLFTTKKNLYLIYSLWLFTICNCYCGVFLIFLGEKFLFLKAVTFLGLQVSFGLTVGSLFKSIIKN
ncbi:MAG: hypothetical protein H6623_09050 [Bdellovibrionaceae bacterium]|nr:hypothetical protein [Pseudobdellovibrionaceae bacterium]